MIPQGPVVGGVMLGVGLMWLFMAAFLTWIERSGIDPGNVIMSGSNWADPKKRAWATRRSMDIGHRQAAFMRHGAPLPAIVMVIGVLVAII